MVWRRIDDNFDGHPKVLDLHDQFGPRRFGAAMGLWGLAQCEAGRLVSMGRQPLVSLVYVRRQLVETPVKAARALEEVGLWEETEGGWKFHDDSDYNPGPGDVEKKRQAKTERQRRWRERRRVGEVGGQEPPVDASTTRTVDAPVDPAPDPTRPDPTRPPPSSPPEGGTLELGYPESKSRSRSPVRQVFDTWVETHIPEAHRGKAVLNAKRRRRIEARLREGYEVPRLQAALRGALADAWIMGTDAKSPRAYRDLETILRDGSQIERLEKLDGQTQADSRYDLRRGVAPPGQPGEFESDDPDEIWGTEGKKTTCDSSKKSSIRR